jgi:hypothetical protein
MTDDDLDWDEWMEMTDAQQEAALEREMQLYNEWWDSLTPLEQYRHSRRSAVEGCLVWRKSMRALGGGDFLREYLRQRQLRLVKLRVWRATGAYPGSA